MTFNFRMKKMHAFLVAMTIYFHGVVSSTLHSRSFVADTNVYSYENYEYHLN